MGRGVFLRFSQDKLDNQSSGLLNSLTSEQQYLSEPRKDWKEVIGGQAAKKLYENTNSNVVDYKGLVRAVTSGATTTIREIGHKLG